MYVKITDTEISCDSILDEAVLSDVNQEVGFIGEEKLDFFNYEEQKDFLEPRTIDPLFALHKQETLMDQKVKPHCPNCKDTKIVESSVPMVGEEECYYCKDQDE